MTYKSIRGTKDMLPPESAEWQKIEAISRNIFKRFGYGEIRTPVIEETGLFVKSVGEETDIVKKEMFSFQDRGERNISLRPEGTAPIVRAYLEHNLDKTGPFQKLYYIGPMFRAERPQAGRLRQFHQLGIEAIGSNSPAIDGEVIKVLVELLKTVGIENYRLKLNNLGCKEDKKKLSKVLKEIFSENTMLKRLCDDCKRRAATNPLRLLDCKNEDCKTTIRGSFKNVEFLCADCKSHFNEVLKFLDILKVEYEVDPYIVRGLDYYTRTVFEVTHDNLGAQNAIGAGGRYDNLIHDMGGPQLGACGFALGIERIFMTLTKQNTEVLSGDEQVIYIATMGEIAHKKGFELMNSLRISESEKILFDMDYENKSLKAQMREADKLGAALVFIIGDEELSKSGATLKYMKIKDKPQEFIGFDEVAKKIRDILKLC